jgi:tetratricopeptide (TPR) repeat protein
VIRTASTGIVCLAFYVMLMVPFTKYLKSKPVVEKLGYVPAVSVLKSIAADQKELVGASFVLKVMMYFGSLVGKEEIQFSVPPDYKSMSRLLHGAVKLDPYNMDAYYFAQSFLTWDVKQYKLANDLLDYGMTYRTWDWYLPFFAGFNSAYFLHDYKKAADYYKKAGDLSGLDLHKSLAGRYMQESGQTDLAIGYLSTMAKGAKNPALRKLYLTRLTAFREVKRIEVARDRFRESRGVVPGSIEQLIGAGFLTPAPLDPYGGQFYLEPDGKVATTSKFAFGGAKNNGTKNAGESDERH